MEPERGTLSSYNAQGIFPIPNENEENFMLRAARCCNKEPLLCEAFEKAQNIVQNIYDIAPSWVPLVFDDAHLHFWEAGCTWSEDANTPSFIQLKKKLQHKPTLLWIYDREEILAHELVHAVRFPLQSKKFEEIFAYYVSYFLAKARKKNFIAKALSSLRTFFGPMFFTPFEVRAFLLLAFFGMLISSFFLLQSSEHLFTLCIFIPLLASVFFLVRLLWTWYRFWQCKKNIRRFYQNCFDMHNVLAIMIRLSDDDIIDIAKKKKIFGQNNENRCSFYEHFLLMMYGTRKGKSKC